MCQVGSTYQVRGQKPEVKVCQEVQTSTIRLKLMLVLEGSALKY